ncbi:MAG: phospho-N-acetylmuramoyl-pentapeptide-transferase [Candidatus Kerfeldbacteria bacterium RIFCSPHIGHO2_02_FULL_42_14]|uniref:Phospho-N-acetylmuramoyl-pentapeptide-transferase n=1 Tax=Candidatus Kerfeldbacteria bacterium RIFCSPHIGHO2_02_FULL_42_14 TaxID=1798540 RepID=A0A1G2AVC2_9BACT|nr:MAG: phospho-N-acetylmuramoyl-pentapeptide-transferase [Candidatus Kerfeldbacteria bacterium RIFCSPHIGHO2_02_FULL_42_14]OGY82302.1 MAG: phospho-N-acetylmuramoyl-pentapeptide-transferase [Candidatus Kerfeldbacteria bacterium RIFCSPHIGHO2_12_FULL_42_13]OGY84730.1 MAG: phospho-N-acetylmuramoyl-pentapeptide-transferase [Candidatus Kerfeldbacteria bacterium RIFCSPLOWO2_02_FULL_42_19]OGY85961.1 MAG: phospho-N-acetylmuramoyl-pentapeptide-transferase [Candidatus Kerfeldbacteria bacterium RIFCSPLOWO2_
MTPFYTHFDILRIFALMTLAFIIAILWTPILTHFLYKYKLGKKIRDESRAPVFARLHRHKAGTPVMGGLLVWVTVMLLALFLYYLAQWTNIELFDQLNFLSRSQTWLPLGALVASAILGLVDDILNVKKVGPHGGGIGLKHRLILYTFIAIVGALWFFFKLDWDVIRVPLVGNFQIGWWYIPLFIFIIVATSFSVNETDGLDGLAGGVLLASFGAYGVIAFVQGRMDLAAFCGIIVGALLAFLWFNIHPARFFMGDTGSMSLGTTLGIVAMLTNFALLLPIIGFLYVLESGSVILQVISKKLLKRKIFLSSPLHHHFEAKGWPETKIVMRFWVIAAVTAVSGLMIFLLDRV